MSPCCPWGIPRFSTRLGVSPVMDAVTADPAGRVSTWPMVMLGVWPGSPGSPFPPGSPCLPAGMPRAMTGASGVPDTDTVGSAPAGRPVTWTEMSGVAPVGPTAPLGMVNRSTASFSVPVFSTAAWVPGSPVTVSPTLMVAAFPAGPTDTLGRGRSEVTYSPRSRSHTSQKPSSPGTGGCSFSSRMLASIWLHSLGTSGQLASPDRLSGIKIRTWLVWRTSSPRTPLSCTV